VELDLIDDIASSPIAICAAKRYAADRAGDLSAWISAAAPDTGRKVAVIGVGPAGLTAGFYLRKKGHRVTVFEARPKLGCDPEQVTAEARRCLQCDLEICLAQAKRTAEAGG